MSNANASKPISSFNRNKWIEAAIKENQIKFFDFNEFSDKRVIGYGALGEVYKAEVKNNDLTVVLKSLYLSDESHTEEMNKKFINELKILIKLEHNKSVNHFYGITKEYHTQKYMIVTKYADGGTLANYLYTNFSNLTGNDKLNLAKQLAQGLKSMHNADIIHCDLNHNNVLIHKGKIKIADLGYSKLSNENLNSKTNCGAFSYIDPTFLRDTENFQLNKKSDIYSLGVLFWLISNGCIPNQYKFAFNEKEKPFHETPDKYIELYQACCDNLPENRPDIYEVNQQLNKIEWPPESNNVMFHKYCEIVDGLVTLLNNLLNKEGSLDKIGAELQSYYDLCSEHPFEIQSYSKDDAQYKLLLGFLYQTGSIVEKNVALALSIYKELSNDNSLAQLFLGYAYREGIGTQKDEKEAFEWFLKSAEGGNARGQCRLGRCYNLGIGTPKDEKKAFEWYWKSAKGGDYLGQNNLGWCYDEGFGTQKDEKKAFDWYLKSAEGGCTIGQCNLAICYENGIETETGVEIQKDERKAFEWYLKSAESGNFMGQNYLGWCYDKGFGTQKNERKAFEWYLKSAEGGNSIGQTNLIWCYRNGMGTQKNEIKAFKWYLKVAESRYTEDNDDDEEARNAEGQYSLGICYEEGIGTFKDISKAIKWYKTATKNGSIDAKKRIYAIFRYNF